METPAQMWTIVIIGISTVFVCLIALVAMVEFFKFVFVRKPKAPASAAAPVAAAPAVAKGVDAAVVAAIVAAIAASSGIPASSLRIASIERSGFNTPVWGHVDRA